jgi:hypothetical protein
VAATGRQPGIQAKPGQSDFLKPVQTPFLHPSFPAFCGVRVAEQQWSRLVSEDEVLKSASYFYHFTPIKAFVKRIQKSPASQSAD